MLLASPPLEEGIELRRADITQPILVLAGVYLEQLEQFLRNRLTPVIHEAATLRASGHKRYKRARPTLKSNLKSIPAWAGSAFLAAEIDCLATAELSQLKALDDRWRILPFFRC